MTDRSFNTECPVCMEAFFDDNGLATEKIAETLCTHLIHSECLVDTGRSLNAGGQRYGVGGFGNRSGCPICQRPVSCWTCSKQAGYFAGFWTSRIENTLKELGPSIDQDGRSMPVPCELIREELRQDDSLTEEQKRLIECDIDDGTSGFCKALTKAGSVEWNVDGVMFARFLTSRGIWKYDKAADSLWLWEWGLQHPTLSKCENCGSQSSRLSVCSQCRESCDAVYYCSRDCQRNDWPRHKRQMCRAFGIMKQGGTREELLQRL